MKLETYPDREMMMLEVADTLVSLLGECLRLHERASFCVPGGSTPGPVFDTLASHRLDWSRVAVFLGDERWVPPDDPRSNTALVRERLLTDRAAAATYVPLYAPTETPEEAIPHLVDGLTPHLPISVLLLGMGTDMHTASLFPGGDNLEAALAPSAPVLLPMRGAGAAEPRVTLTAPVLSGAMHTHVLITGTEKREALERARRLPPTEAPIRAVLAGATVHWSE